MRNLQLNPGNPPQYNLRLYTLNSQLRHQSKENLEHIVQWLVRKVRRCMQKKEQATAVLKESGQDEDALRKQWTAQIEAQTCPLPHMLCFHLRVILLTMFLFRSVRQKRRNCCQEGDCPIQAERCPRKTYWGYRGANHQ